jgi:CheY-like chemotaxis protein
VVALTGYTQPADLDRMRQAGFDHGLRKPVDGRELAAVIGALRRKPA